MKKIALFGECMIELNGEIFATMRQSYGGDSLNTATYLSRVSLPEQISVHYVSALGKDPLSITMKNAWQQDQIQTNFVLTDHHRQAGLYLIQLDQQGERSFLYWRSESAARYIMQHSDIEKIFSELMAMDVFYLTGISLAILPEQDRALFIHYLKKLKQAGVKIAFDSNFRPRLWQSLSQAQSCYAQLLPLVDIALLTFDDEQALWGDQNPQQSFERLSQLGIETIVLKQGKCGVIFQQNFEQQWVATDEIVKPVDTTSAGDAFNAGFLNGYLQGKNLKQCCQQGNQLAAVVIQHQGAIIEKGATAHFVQQFNN